jgi:hypothetical protein
MVGQGHCSFFSSDFLHGIQTEFSFQIHPTMPVRSPIKYFVCRQISFHSGNAQIFIMVAELFIQEIFTKKFFPYRISRLSLFRSNFSKNRCFKALKFNRFFFIFLIPPEATNELTRSFSGSLENRQL